jgi:hypothetical protein
LLSTRPDLVPPEYIDERLKPVDADQLVSTVRVATAATSLSWNLWSFAKERGMADDTKAGFDLRSVRKKTGKRGEAKLPPRPEFKQLIDFSPWETRPLPYFSAVPEQRWKDNPTWAGLSWQDKGFFLLLCDWCWLYGGAIRSDDLSTVAQRIGMDLGELGQAVNRLLEADLLYEIQGRLIQLELREQQIITAREPGSNNGVAPYTISDSDFPLQQQT